MNYKEQYREYLDLFEDYVNNVLSNNLTDNENKLTNAMKYSLTAGGKRIRPVLMLAFCDIFGYDKQKALPYATAIECVHTSSLIHDDMPCLDNDDMRRGRPSCHKAYGEGLAMLAGDALMNFAYELSLKNAETKSDIDAIKFLSECTGYSGMLGGQAYDLVWENTQPKEDKLLTIDYLKTSKLVQAPIVMASLLSGKYEKKIEEFGECLGLMFQFVDDLLDELGTSKDLGKTTGKDKQAGKLTAVCIYGIQKTKQKIAEQKQKCLDILKDFPNNRFMIEFVNNLEKRES